MESWRKVWREGIAPQLSMGQLQTLRNGLATNDRRLRQGVTTDPLPLHCVQDWPVQGACVTCYGFAFEGFVEELGPDQGTQHTVGEVEEFFAKVCFEADTRLGEPGAVRYFLNWFDDTLRQEMREELLPEVDREIDLRVSLEQLTAPLL